MKEPVYAIGYLRLSDAKQILGGGKDNQIDAIKRYFKEEGLTLWKGKIFEEI